MPSIRIKRGTRAQLDSAAAAGQLRQGEPYLITDEGRLAVGLTSFTYERVANAGEVADGNDVDGGSASSIFLPTQLIDGGTANG